MGNTEKVELKKVDFAGTLSDEQVEDLVDEFVRSERKEHEEKRKYYQGRNPTIMDRQAPKNATVDNKIPISYARKIIKTIVGYMYKPGLVKYQSDNERYLDTLREVFDLNREPIKTAQLGEQASIQGIAYEFHYIDGVPLGEPVQMKAVPRFAMLPATEVIPVYDYAIEPNLVAFIRAYMRGEQNYADVYYPLRVENFRWKREGEKVKVERIGEGMHPYPMVPLNIYKNNEEMMGDFESVQPLIDAYDVLMSDSMNEFDRFAWAYLVLKGFNLSKDDVESIKWRRVFQNLDEKSAIEFLTKEIPTEFIKYMSEWVRQEIHSQSGIPDISDIRFGAAASGTTIDKFIYLMELYTDPKEALFRDGLQQRIKLIDQILSVRDGKAGTWDEVDIIMSRNLPQDDLTNGQALQAYAGHVTEATLLAQFAPFVQDVQAEIEALKEEKEENIAMFGGGLFEEDNAEEDTSEDSRSLRGDRQDNQQERT